MASTCKQQVFGRWIWCVILLVLALSLPLGCRERQGPRVSILAILPLTGSAGYIGQDLKAGMELARDQLFTNEGNGQVRVELLFEDSMNDPKTGVSAYRKWATESKVKAVVCAMSTVTKAILPLVNQDQIPLMATVVSAEGIARESRWAFRFFTKAEIDARVMAEYAFDSLGLRRVAILHVQDDFGLSYAHVFSKTFEALGGAVVLVENFSPGETSFLPILLKLKSVDEDGVYILSYANNLALIPRQMKELGIRTTILSIGTISQGFVIQQAGGSAEGAYYTNNAFNTYAPSTDEMREFIQGFQSKYGKHPEYWEVFGYDAVALIAEACRKGGASRSGIRRGLLSIGKYQGVAGEITVSPDGEVDFPVIIARIVGGEPSRPLLEIGPRESQ